MKPRGLPQSELDPAAFDAHLALERIRSTREICVLASVLYIAFGILDLVAIPSALGAVWAVRTAVVVVNAAIFGLTYHRIFQGVYARLMVVLFLVMGGGIEVMVYLSAPGDVARHTYYAGMMLVVMALYSWTFLAPWQTSTIGFLLVVMYVAIALGAQGLGSEREWPVLLSNCFFFVSANVLGTFANAQRNRYLGESFLWRQKLVDDLQRTEAQHQQSAWRSEHDPLTGLANRALLDRRLNEMIGAAAAGDGMLALLYIDLDGFKPINDRRGHAAGDIVLRIVAQRLSACMRGGDLLARHGGDEFIAVLELGQGRAEAAERVAQAILAAIEQPIRDPEITEPLSASIGIALYPLDAPDAESLIAAGDAQMYRAKQSGRGRFCIAPTGNQPSKPDKVQAAP